METPALDMNDQKDAAPMYILLDCGHKDDDQAEDFIVNLALLWKTLKNHRSMRLFVTTDDNRPQSHEPNTAVRHFRERLPGVPVIDNDSERKRKTLIACGRGNC